MEFTPLNQTTQKKSLSVRIPCGSSTFHHHCHCLRVGLSHLKEHKYRHNFVDTLIPLCNCGLMELENTTHFLLRCNFYPNLRKTLLDSIIKLIGSISDHSEAKLINILLYGDKNCSIDTNSSILQATISFLKASGRFDMPLITAE